eukprot:Stramenopile-MAST_4_protein_6579
MKIGHWPWWVGQQLDGPLEVHVVLAVALDGAWLPQHQRRLGRRGWEEPGQIWSRLLLELLHGRQRTLASRGTRFLNEAANYRRTLAGKHPVSLRHLRKVEWCQSSIVTLLKEHLLCFPGTTGEEKNLHACPMPIYGTM